MSARSRNINNWPHIRFGDVVRNVNDNVRDPLSSDLERYVGLDHLDPESLHIKRWGLIADGTTFTRRFAAGQVLFGKRRAYQRKVAVAEFDGICSGDILVFEPANDQLLPELLPFIVQSDGFFAHALGTSAGSLSPRTKWQDLARYEFALPPLDEQRRIAEILWAADEERQSLLNVQEQSRQLVVALAEDLFDGKLTKRTTFGELAAENVLSFQTGPFGTVLKASSYVEEGTPIINPVNMKDGRLETHDGPFLNDEECERLAKYRMQEGDILQGRKGDMDNLIFVTTEYEGFIVGSDCIRIRLNGGALKSQYLYYFLRSPQVRAWVTHHAYGTTMPGVNEKLLSRLEVSIPAASAQDEVITSFRRVDSTLESLTAKIDASSLLLKCLINDLLHLPIAK